jgi:hypothetical protein
LVIGQCRGDDPDHLPFLGIGQSEIFSGKFLDSDQRPKFLSLEMKGAILAQKVYLLRPQSAIFVPKPDVVESWPCKGNSHRCQDRHTKEVIQGPFVPPFR